MRTSRESVDARAHARMSDVRSRIGVLDAAAVGVCAIGLLAILGFSAARSSSLRGDVPRPPVTTMPQQRLALPFPWPMPLPLPSSLSFVIGPIDGPAVCGAIDRVTLRSTRPDELHAAHHEASGVPHAGRHPRGLFGGAPRQLHAV